MEKTARSRGRRAGAQADGTWLGQSRTGEDLLSRIASSWYQHVSSAAVAGFGTFSMTVFSELRTLRSGPTGNFIIWADTNSTPGVMSFPHQERGITIAQFLRNCTQIRRVMPFPPPFLRALSYPDQRVALLRVPFSADVRPNGRNPWDPIRQFPNMPGSVGQKRRSEASLSNLARNVLLPTQPAGRRCAPNRTAV